jgi:hypothetical protein
MFFLNSYGVKYSQSRTDPFFPTDSSLVAHEGNASMTFFNRVSTNATVLGCADYYELCFPHQTACYHFAGPTAHEKSLNESIPANSPSAEQGQEDLNANKLFQAIAFVLLGIYVLADSSNTIGYLGNQGLDVWTKGAFETLALGLPDPQWEAEAQNIFNASLARLQLNVVDLARGFRVPSNAPQYNALDDEGMRAQYGAACDIIKIEGVGWKNISFFWFVTLLTLSVVLSVGTIEIGDSLVLEHVLRTARKLGLLTVSELLLPALRRLAAIRWRSFPSKARAVASSLLAPRKITRRII